jgi:hypothetical protein
MTRLTTLCGVILAMSVLSLALGQEKDKTSSPAVSADLGEKLVPCLSKSEGLMGKSA